MGSGQISMIRQHLRESKVVIIDHHLQESDAEEPGIIEVNTMDAGIEENISGSGVTYLVARSMGEGNADLSAIAILGAIGDSQIGSIGEEWGLFGINKEIVKDAVNAGKIRLGKGLRLWGRYTRPIHKTLEYSLDPFIPNVSGSESKAVQFLQELGIPVKKENGDWRTLSDLSEEEQGRLASGIIAERVRNGYPNAEWIFGDVYELLDKGRESRDAGEFATLLNACGKMGKAYLGVELCLNVAKAFLDVKWVLENYRKALGDSIRWIYTQLEKGNGDAVRKTDNAWYVLAGSKISEHIISNVISVVEKSVSPGMPVFAFADSEEGVKVSARASEKLVQKGINLKEIAGKAAEKVGGHGGGHSGAAGAEIPKGKENAFIEAVEAILSGKGEKSDTNKSLEAVNNLNPGEPDNSEDETEEDENHGRGRKKEAGNEAGGSEEMEGEGLVQYFRS